MIGVAEVRSCVTSGDLIDDYPETPDAAQVVCAREDDSPLEPIPMDELTPLPCSDANPMMAAFYRIAFALFTTACGVFVLGTFGRYCLNLDHHPAMAVSDGIFYGAFLGLVAGLGFGIYAAWRWPMCRLRKRHWPKPELRWR
jgi:hypothetical protein